MSNQDLKNIAAKYLKGEASAEEQAMLEEWFAATENDPVLLSAEELHAIREDMLGRIRERAGYIPPEQEDRPHLHTRTALLRIAAMVVLVVGTAAMFYYLRPQQAAMKAPLAMKDSIIQRVMLTVTHTQGVGRKILPDSSVVLLNGAAAITYERGFSGEKRELFLENGEIFVDVKKQTERPFVVHAGNTVTTVLGTSFNVKMNPKKSKVSIVVKTGKIKVRTGDNPADSGYLVTPNRGIEINTANNNIHTFSQQADIALSWCKRELVFHQLTMQEVATLLENRYQVNIRLMTPESQRFKVSGDFSMHHSVDEILDAICLVHRLTYKKKSNSYFVY
ncbi:MAG TPA: FecR domain-containing protein [Chitinophaga sp.]|uniref:FecR family protein n=1 Tax=Chitinophaga sp. TaxID=1869181 RepID=UPI002C0978AC|nr:FecR domain-containing protein [Chitinophaga sp.]HVI46661.1 FecR domain-containing protein [Chitinophaga sp.]